MSDDKVLTIGKAWIKDMEAINAWYSTVAPEWYKEVWREYIYPMPDGPTKKLLTGYHNAQEFNRDERWPEATQSKIRDRITMLEKARDYAEAFGMPFDLMYLDGKIVAIRHGRLVAIFPPELFRVELFRDYYMSIGQLAAFGEDTDSTGSLSLISATEQSSRLTRTKLVKSADDLRAEIKSVQDKTHKDIAPLYEEIERIRKEMEAKKQDMMALMEAKIEEMEEKVFHMENQIFALDSQIYAIRCFNGEVVEFSMIRDGSHTLEDAPVVLFQKVRYLDEELGQLTSIYDVTGEQYKIIEELLKYNDLAFERFCPSQKCVVVLRVSKMGRFFAPHNTWVNCLDSFEFHHSHRVCVLVRNGDALYAGWTDEDRIDIAEDVFYTPGTVVLDSEEDKKEKRPWGETEYERKQKIKKARSEHQTEMYRRASRLFLFTILQGLLERKEIISIPEKASVIKSAYEPNPYIIFSASDNWLEDNRYGSLPDLIKLCNQKAKAGDDIMTLLYLRPQYSQERWNRNDRGIGYADRTHDVSADDATVYPINKIEFGKPYRWITYTNPQKQERGERPWHTSVSMSSPKDEELIKNKFSEGTIILSDEVTQDRYCYISLEKDMSYCGARANFRVESYEYINLTYMCSPWLLYIISSKKLGGWQIGGKEVSFAHAIRYLNKALEYVKDREETEHELISEHFSGLRSIPEWQVELNHWKLEKGVRTITPYQAKRFAKHLVELRASE